MREGYTPLTKEDNSGKELVHRDERKRRQGREQNPPASDIKITERQE